MQNPNNLSKSMRTSYIAIVLFLVSSLCMKAQQNMSTDFNGLTLTIRPFYSDYVAKMDEIPVDTWSANPYLHCQFIETIPSSLITPADTFFIDQAPVKMLTYGDCCTYYLSDLLYISLIISIFVSCLKAF